MKIARLEVLQLRWDPKDPPTVGSAFLRVWTDDGLCGLGEASPMQGGLASLGILKRDIAPAVIGADPLDHAVIHDRLLHRLVKLGPEGALGGALAALDIALWDLKGRLLSQPVYNLLGGRVRETIPVYASRLYSTEDLDALAAEAAGYLRQGFGAMKLRFGYGPREGPAGMRRNVALVRTVSEVIGDDVDLMADAYMGWDVAYCTRILPLLEPYRLRWIEEPVSPDDVEGYARVKELANSRGILVSGGEHEYTRYGMRQLLERRAVDVLQPDVNRVGGISEAQKVWAMAAAHDIPVIPHAGQSHNYHLVISHLNSPIAEYFPPPPEGTLPDMNEAFWWIFTGEPRARDGHVRLSGRPGLDLELNQEVVDKYRVALPR